jgi:hypothetical protein
MVTRGPVRRKTARVDTVDCALICGCSRAPLEMFAKMHESSTPLFHASNAQVERLVLLGFE